jgi:hypothetical protein
MFGGKISEAENAMIHAADRLAAHVCMVPAHLSTAMQALEAVRLVRVYRDANTAFFMERLYGQSPAARSAPSNCTTATILNGVAMDENGE